MTHVFLEPLLGTDLFFPATTTSLSPPPPPHPCHNHRHQHPPATTIHLPQPPPTPAGHHHNYRHHYPPATTTTMKTPQIQKPTQNPQLTGFKKKQPPTNKHSLSSRLSLFSRISLFSRLSRRRAPEKKEMGVPEKRLAGEGDGGGGDRL
ncbi:extensin-like [Helianthus annuus]|uniref:extensin-like n=1 Tax=Helianthus annuus TaxID=4232 RepID=UPI000B8F3225|nr:extensin-like [Helianthus annuus]